MKVFAGRVVANGVKWCTWCGFRVLMASATRVSLVTFSCRRDSYGSKSTFDPSRILN